MKKIIRILYLILIAGLMAFSLTSCKKDKTCEEDPNQEKCEKMPPVEKTCVEDPTQEKCQTEEIVKCTDINQDYRLILEGEATDYVFSDPFTEKPTEEKRDVRLVIEGDADYISYKDGEAEYIYDKHTYDIYQIINDEKILTVESDIPLDEFNVTVFVLTKLKNSIIINSNYSDSELIETDKTILDYEVDQETGRYYTMSADIDCLTDKVTQRLLKIDFFVERGIKLSCEATRYENTEIDNSRYSELKDGDSNIVLKVNKPEWFNETVKEKFQIKDVALPEDAKFLQSIEYENVTNYDNINKSICFQTYSIDGILIDGAETLKKFTELLYEIGYQYITQPYRKITYEECIATGTDSVLIFLADGAVDSPDTESIFAQVYYFEKRNRFSITFVSSYSSNIE